MTNWQVMFSKKAVKQSRSLSKAALLSLQVLIEDLSSHGPAPGKHWSHYGKLQGMKKDKRHCHLQKGNPTYVCCWIVYKTKKLIEVYYVGTHEQAPY